MLALVLAMYPRWSTQVTEEPVLCGRETIAVSLARQMATGRGVPYPVDDKTAQELLPMAWVVLIVSGMFEAVWATALGKSDGLTRIGPTIVFVAGLIVSMGGLAYAMKTLPTGTSYAIWVAVGAVLTIVYAMVFDGEPVSALKVLFLAGIIGCVIGLKVVH